MSEFDVTQQIPLSAPLFSSDDDVVILNDDAAADNPLVVRDSVDREEHKHEMDNAHVYDDNDVIAAAAAAAAADEGGDGEGVDEVRVIGARGRITVQDNARKPPKDDWKLEEAVATWKSEKKKKSRSWWEKSRIYEVVYRDEPAAANPHSEKFKHKVSAATV